MDGASLHIEPSREGEEEQVQMKNHRDEMTLVEKQVCLGQYRTVFCPLPLTTLDVTHSFPLSSNGICGDDILAVAVERPKGGGGELERAREKDSHGARCIVLGSAQWSQRG